MNFQEKMIETTLEIRARAAELANLALTTARSSVSFAAQRAGGLKGPLAALKIASQDLNQVARRHVTRFVRQNRTLAAEAGKDLGALARSTYTNIAKRGATVTRKPRKSTAARKRSTRKAA
jgi:hypothetical protein